jgi:hypothetical protein
MRRAIIVLLTIFITTSCSSEETPAQAVCKKLTIDVLAEQGDRLAYLKTIEPEADATGFGIGPAVRIAIMDMEKGAARDVQAADFARIDRVCSAVLD